LDPDSTAKVYNLIISLPVLLWSLTVHEWAHAWSAHKCGDDTALYEGRVSLNPLVHLDPIGTLFIIVSFFGNGFGFGWAKPVPVNHFNFRYPSRDDIIVSLAGVTANLLNALFFAAVFQLLRRVEASQWIAVPLIMAQVGVFTNLALMFFNLIPIPPLDGSHVLHAYLPYHLQREYDRIAPYGLFILFGLIIIGATRYLIAVPTFLIGGFLLH